MPMLIDQDVAMHLQQRAEDAASAEAKIVKLTEMVKICVAHLRAYGCYTVPLQAEQLLAELQAIKE
jgi:hypothetical protein